jgi:hypothetical protein
MPKPNPLTQGLEHKAAPVSPSAQPAVSATRARHGKAAPESVRPDRANRVLIGAHFAPAVQRALKITAAEEGTTIQALLAEGINTVFAKRRKPEIAKISA